jgi:hypothetical protein
VGERHHVARLLPTRGCDSGVCWLVCDKPPSRNSHIAAGPLPPLAVPASLLDSLTARLDRLGPAKEIAQIGAVIGREFSRPLLAAAASESANWLQAALAQLIASGVIFVSGELPDKTYTFKHALVRDAAYATIEGKCSPLLMGSLLGFCRTEALSEGIAARSYRIVANLQRSAEFGKATYLASSDRGVMEGV